MVEGLGNRCVRVRLRLSGDVRTDVPMRARSAQVEWGRSDRTSFREDVLGYVTLHPLGLEKAI